MKHYVYFLIGLILSIIIIKIIIPKPIIVKIFPTLANYDDIEYVDEEGKIYKYELILMQ